VRVARISIEVGPPFRLDLPVWALRRRAHNTIGVWDVTTHTRTLDRLATVLQDPDGDVVGEPGPIA